MSASSPHIDIAGELEPRRDLPAAHARLDLVEKRLRENDHDALRAAEADSAAHVIANGHRELAALVVKNHASSTRSIERVQALLLGVIAEIGLRLNGASAETSGLVGLAVIIFFAGSPDVARMVIDRFAARAEAAAKAKGL